MDTDMTPLRDALAPHGMIRVVPLMRLELEAVLRGAEAGEPLSAILAGAVTAVHQQIEKPESGQSMPCTRCLQSLTRRPRSYAVLVSDPPQSGTALAFVLCEACGPDPAAIVAAVQPFLEAVWPGVRQLHPYAPGPSSRT